MQDKEKSTERKDGAVATIMALDRALRHKGNTESVYDIRGFFLFSQFIKGLIILKNSFMAEAISLQRLSLSIDV